MNKENNDTMLLEKLLDRYRLTRPVPPDVQDSILSAKKRNLVSILKTTGAFTAAYGGYYVMVARPGADRAATPAVKTLSLDEIRARYKWVDEITLYNGKIFRGAVMSRGETYRVLTTEGIVMIPRSQIKMVKPLNISGEEHKTAPGDSLK